MKHLREYQVYAIHEAWDALKKNDDPVLLEASVGSGKSIMIGTILKTMQDQNKRVLCLVNSAELVRNEHRHKVLRSSSERDVKIRCSSFHRITTKRTFNSR